MTRKKKRPPRVLPHVERNRRHGLTGMKTRTVTIKSLIDTEQLSAELLQCPDCDCEIFLIYTPEGINHIHFQCLRCGTSFCDGCTAAPEEGGAT